MPGQRFARVDVRRWPVLGAAACRVLGGWSRCSRIAVDGCCVSRRHLAQLLGCAVQNDPARAGGGEGRRSADRDPFSQRWKILSGLLRKKLSAYHH